LGWFGLAGTETALIRTHLPTKNRQSVKDRLLKDLQNSKYNKSFFVNLQRQITAYFEGSYINFSLDIPIALACPEQPVVSAVELSRGNDFSEFAVVVLKTCRNIKLGQTITYAQLAKQAGRPNAARAVGQVLAKNPLPLIIPCHRVICSDGSLGGFSATAGLTLKKKMLELEKTSIKSASPPEKTS